MGQGEEMNTTFIPNNSHSVFMYNHVTFSNILGTYTLHNVQSNYGFKHEIQIYNKIIIQED